MNGGEKPDKSENVRQRDIFFWQIFLKGYDNNLSLIVWRCRIDPAFLPVCGNLDRRYILFQVRDPSRWTYPARRKGPISGPSLDRFRLSGKKGANDRVRRKGRKTCRDQEEHIRDSLPPDLSERNSLLPGFPGAEPFIGCHGGMGRCGRLSAFVRIS
jgi:hypothetical protein